ncbi:uncharacterized protein PG986_002296 [Apiospora aurea]|uniref:Uncharacterized protein n=1 Tax=Apiospora aurea TaxID=335848 RepID=A0ABR1QZG5_9PEZI
MVRDLSTMDIVPGTILDTVEDKESHHGKFGQYAAPTPSPKTGRDGPSKARRPSHRRSILQPDKSLPDHAADRVRRIAKKRLPDHDKAAAELAPLFGLGDDLLADQRAACLFKHPGLLQAVEAFERKFLDAEGWDAALPQWRLVYKMLLPTAPPTSDSEDSEYDDDAGDDVWTRPEYPDFKSLGGWDVNYHYARFVARVLAVVRERDPAGAGVGGSQSQSQSQLVHWVRDAAAAEDAWWALFHALLYLQLETMRDRAKSASLWDKVRAFVRK